MRDVTVKQPANSRFFSFYVTIELGLDKYGSRFPLRKNDTPICHPS